MAANQRITKCQRRMRRRKMGRTRKSQMSRHSTLSYAELFAGLGEPGTPASKASNETT